MLPYLSTPGSTSFLWPRKIESRERESTSESSEAGDDVMENRWWSRRRRSESSDRYQRRELRDGVVGLRVGVVGLRDGGLWGSDWGTEAWGSVGRRREGVGVRVMDCRTEGVGGRLLQCCVLWRLKRERVKRVRVRLRCIYIWGVVL